MKKRALLIFLLTGMVFLSGCSGDSGSGEAAADSTASGATLLSDIDTSSMFTDRDLEVGYDEETAVQIECSADSAACDSDAVKISGSTVTITDEGTYILSGTLSDGMVLIQADDTDKIQLVLDGINISNSSSAAIYAAQADKVFITTAPGSENVLSNGGSYTAVDESNIDSVIFSKADLTLNGEGSLTVSAEAGHGIVSKDDLVLTSGTYEITSKSHGLSGKDSVRIVGGTYGITCGKDGIHSENTEDDSLGYVYIAGGTFQIVSDGDGISASGWLLSEGGDFTIQAGGGSDNAEQHTQDSPEPSRQDTGSTDTQAEDSVSCKGLKSSVSLDITGGSYSVDSADDALHSNGSVSVSDGTFEIRSGDDGIHADSAVSVSGGTITVLQSYEGLEGLTIDISGGDISVSADDDGLNAAGGTDSSGTQGPGQDMFSETEGADITISGGVLHINAGGDGIDSNGSLHVSGGETYVSGPTDNANGALDYNGDAEISGGIFVAAGSSGMAQNFGSSSTQGAILVNVASGTAGSTVTLTDSQGSELLSWQAEKEFSSILVSCPDILDGETYTLTAGGSSEEITMNGLIYGSSGGMGGGMGGRDQGQNAPGTPGGGMPDRESSGDMGPGNTAPDGMDSPNEDPGSYDPGNSRL